MVDTTEIQIFVSCPGDVEQEKDIVKEVCERINNQLITNSCSIRYAVKEWKTLVRQSGLNPQVSINISIGNYDIYFGIWWMRFGSKTGNVNPVTGEESESGTHEEFLIAYDRWQSNKNPEIFLFFKKSIPYDDDDSHEQYGKIISFKKAQKNNGWFYEFESREKFKEQITDLLYGKALNFCRDKKIELKQEFLNADIAFKLKFSVPEIPETYLSRQTSHFLTLKERADNPFLQIEKQSLCQLILNQSKIIVLGDAGSGKSTELRNLYFELNKDKSALIPLYQQLNTYTPSTGIEDFLPAHWREIPQNLLLIIWDGLDEIQPEHFNTVVRQITNFIEKNIEIKFVISCRTNFYELPVNNSPGTLVGFESYFLNDLVLYDVKKYYAQRYNSKEADNFIKEVFDNNLEDIITKPFFLMLLADRYADLKQLSIKRADLYQLFILSRIDLDQNHFKNTFNVREKKEEIVSLLEKVALSMEILARNHINESEIVKIITRGQFKTLKYCTAFKKQEGEETIWQFEHNNIQEYLAARALSKMSFDKVILFLTFEKQSNKLIPSWVNTLAFLFSILNFDDILFGELMNWLLKNEKEIIVKFEKDKISEEIRIKIFQQIFNYYKSYDVWVRSNNFTDKDLSRFGQSETTINFLLNEIQQENTRTTKINAIALLGYLKYDNAELELKVSALLLKVINEHIDDVEFIRSCIYSIKYSELTTPALINKLLKVLREKKNQYVRSAIYSLLMKSNNIDQYVDYLIEGYELLEVKNVSGRSNTNLIDESWNLNECIKRIKSSEGLKKLIIYISGDNNHLRYINKDIIKAIIDNIVTAYNNDETIFQGVFEWFLKETKSFRIEQTASAIEFFKATNTRDKAFYKVWDMTEDNVKNKSYSLSRLATNETLQFIIDKYNGHDIANADLERFIRDLQWTRNDNFSYFKELIKNTTSFQLQLPPQIDYETVRKKKQQEDFDLLFDFKEFENETFRIFNEEQKTTFTYDELFDITTKNGQEIELEDFYSGAALHLLREFCEPNHPANKKVVHDWFEKDENIEWYLISTVYNYFSNNKEISISENQKKIIGNWCLKKVQTVDFRNAITTEGDSTTTETIPIYLWFFSRKFNIKYPDEILLDMLSFDYFEHNEHVGIDYLIDQLDKEKINKQILINLHNDIKDISVLKNHIKYATENNLIETYPLILLEITNLNHKYFYRNDFLDIYYKNTKDSQALKNIIDKGDSYTKWQVVEKLRNSNEDNFLELYLINILNNNPISEDVILAAENLIMIQNIKGLEFYTNWLKLNRKVSENNRSISCLQTLHNINALPSLIELLELSYQVKIEVEPFEDLGSVVINALYNIALHSESNFTTVRNTMLEFMRDNKDKYKNVNYLLHTVSRLDQQFYMNKAPVYDIDQVKEKIKLIS